MSSMRNAAPRRSHRERAQPQARSKWGLLEKHKDYSLRAADYNKKKKKLGILSQKSRERNPDEFAFGMLSSDKAHAGKHGRGDGLKNQLDHGVVEKLKGQDAGYLRTVMGRTRKELEKVKEEIGLDNVFKRRGAGMLEEENARRVVFGEDGQPVKKRRKIELENVEADEDSDVSEDAILEPAAEYGIEEEGVISDAENRPLPELAVAYPLLPELVGDSESDSNQSKVKTKRQLLAEANALTRRKLEIRRRKKIREARANKLEILKKRQKSIMAAATELELQRAKMARTIGGTNKNGVTFKIRERKR